MRRDCQHLLSQRSQDSDPRLRSHVRVSQRPSAETGKVITEAGAAFTGVAAGTVRKKLVVCIGEALKDQRDDRDGMAQVAMDGTSMMMQCQMQFQIFAGLNGGVVNGGSTLTVQF